MATISSLGIGSGLDSESIVTKLVALEKQPLRLLESRATFSKNKISEFGKIQSQVSALADVATRISTASAWSARTTSTSNSSAATISAASTATATTFTLDVDQLASKQSLSSTALASADLVGAGTLTFRLGAWSTGGAAFTPASGSLDVTVTADAADTISTLAAKVNAANAGVVATVFNDGTQQRLLFASKNSGEAAGFRVQVADTGDANTNTNDTGLSRFGFDPELPAGGNFGMARAGATIQYGQDAKARINGLPVTSKTNTIAEALPGVTVNLLATTTQNYGLGNEIKSPVSMAVKEDVTVAVKNVQDFIDAYNALATNLAELTKYDAKTKTAGLFQGDSSVVGLQNLLRSMVSSVTAGSAYQRLNDVGVERQLNGTLTMNTSKLGVAANNGTELQKLFTTNNSNTQTNGFALKFSSFGKAAVVSGGAVFNKAAALDKELVTNSLEQDKVNTRAARTEERLRKQYSALDARMASLNALSSYVNQQVTAWNKTGNN